LTGILIVLAFGVRPALRKARPGPAVVSAAGTRELAAGTVGADAAHPALRPPEPAELDPERIRAQEILDQVTGHLKREPSQSSRLLQSWIHSD
jgi:flagellar M-ring protein FliF